MIYSIINQKGGVAKTSTTAAIGSGLTLRDNKVLMIDLDAQRNLTDIVGGSSEGLTILDLLTGKSTAKEVIQRTEGGDIIPSSPGLALEGILTETGKEYRLREALEPIREHYDYIIIDCPPSLAILTINALTASDACIIPAQADKFSLQAIEQFGKTFEVIKKYTNNRLYISGVVLTRYNNRAILSRDYRDMIGELAVDLGTSLFHTNIRECISVKEAQAMQESIFKYNPKSNAAKDYNELIDEIIEREIIKK